MTLQQNFLYWIANTAHIKAHACYRGVRCGSLNSNQTYSRFL